MEKVQAIGWGQGSISMEPVDLGQAGITANVAAHAIVMNWISRRDPTFLNDARADFDALLGHLSIKHTAPDEVYVEARKIFETIIKIADTSEKDKMTTRSLRQRLGAWLLRSRKKY
jgi:hypothetical protein